MVANGRKRSQKGHQTVANGLKQSQTDVNGRKQSQTVVDGRKRSQMVANGHKLSRMSQMSQMSQSSCVIKNANVIKKFKKYVRTFSLLLVTVVLVLV